MNLLIAILVAACVAVVVIAIIGLVVLASEFRH